MIAHPGERQIGKRGIVFVEPIERDRVGRRRDASRSRQHHALGDAGCAGRIEDDRNVGALAGRNLIVQLAAERSIRRERRAAVMDHALDCVQSRVIIVAQPARFVVEDVRDGRQAFGHRRELVDLLLVLHGGKANIRVSEHECKLLRNRIGVDRHRDRPEHLGRHDGPVEPRPIAADDGDAVAAREAEAGQARRVSADLGEHLRPGPGVPDPEILVPHRRTAGKARGIAHQQFRERVRAGIRHLVLPSAGGPLPPIDLPDPYVTLTWTI